MFFDSFSGNILWQTGEMQTSSPFPHEDILGRIDYVDLEYGTMKYNEQYLESIDRKTRKPVFKPIQRELTPQELLEQKLKEIEELKKQLEGNGK
ncbi:MULTISPECIES: hypothetical protein [unclassified Lysinibacillus]|uniref:hypothetical protein n=1 Tax=unclassified Lysinibacillus TaxID=2636778 RepID=UPI0011162435|nr:MULTISPECIES: hypothetical protein [unclassified Lysinibacillus]